MPLDTASRFPDPDAAYRLIVEAHRDLDDAQSHVLDAALILILANQIGDLAVLEQALTLARTALEHPKSGSGAWSRKTC